ncbi:Synaptonemal complex central element protein 1 [Pteropus alecto]|uniref:Synaptonemal complex central element protein 1 n=1 Tax=Pteropus alecto TaxID=9402 RepID=L5KMH4_PTEAL|nr:Synaptonemal complex central element protein 1 [Pteropus alecto]
MAEPDLHKTTRDTGDTTRQRFSPRPRPSPRALGPWGSAPRSPGREGHGAEREHSPGLAAGEQVEAGGGEGRWAVCAALGLRRLPGTHETGADTAGWWGSSRTVKQREGRGCSTPRNPQLAAVRRPQGLDHGCMVLSEKQAMLQECKERISILNSQIEEEKNRQRKLRLDFEEQLEELMSQHKDLWEFHRPEHLAQEIGALDSSKEQLLKEEKLVEAKLEDVRHRLCSQFGVKGYSDITEGLFLRSPEAASAVRLFEEENGLAQALLADAAQHHEQLQQKCQQLQQKRQRLKEELEKLGLQVPAQAQSKQEDGAGPAEAVSPGVRWQGTETAHERS